MHRSLAMSVVLLSAFAAAKGAERSVIRQTDPVNQAASESTLASVRRSDSTTRDSQGNIAKLSPQEHMRRANVYNSNRAFVEARAHWQALINYYPSDSHIPEALLGIAKSYFLAKDYDDGYPIFNRLAQDYPNTKEGREALNYSAASLLRMGRFAESAARYEEYCNRYPSGERIDTAYLNVIDTLREANKPKEALAWVTKTRQRFAGGPVETNAIFAALRLHVAESHWPEAIATADELSRRSFSKAVLTSPSEVAYLKAFSIEQSGKKDEAFTAYLAVPDSVDSYYGWLATQRLDELGGSRKSDILAEREQRVANAIATVSDLYPAPYRATIIHAAKERKLDPRFILALIRQESVFKPLAKSPAGARGLLQLTMDAAQKYAPGAGLSDVRENQLYQPETSIMLGSEYIESLAKMFPGLLEPIAASYNGGEDNVARWLKRSKRKDAGVFTSEIGFEETKGYVQKVMSNYRVYRQLYTADLVRR